VRNARVEALGVEVAAFECLVVALDRVLGAADFLREAGALLCERRAVGAVVGGGVLYGLADEGPVAVELGELAEDGGFELVTAEAVPVAGSAAELLAPGAGVVVVVATVAFADMPT